LLSMGPKLRHTAVSTRTVRIANPDVAWSNK
jgi:hypothetical protein